MILSINYKKYNFKAVMQVTTVAAPTPASCEGQSIDLSSCTANSNSSFAMLFTTCNVPTVTSISPLSITYDTELTITGNKSHLNNTCFFNLIFKY